MEQAEAGTDDYANGGWRMTLPVPNERVYSRGPDKLRSPERRERLEVEKVLQKCLQHCAMKTLLDIGTGTGLFAEAFQNAGIAVSGVDIKAEMVEAAQKYVPAATFVLAPAEKLPFADGSFDATFFGVVFHEVSDYAAALREAHRVSRCGTFILEWQHRQEDFGPPLEHRLTQGFIKDLSLSIGYLSVTTIPLETLILYELHK